MSAWKGQLTLGLVSLPVTLKAAVRPESFNLLHKCGPRRRSRVSQVYVCKRENIALEWKDLIKGYEYQPGKYLDVPADEEGALKSRSSRELHITEFVRLAEIDPIHLHDSYFVIPAKEGERGYSVLYHLLRITGLAAVTWITMSKRERVAVLYARGGGIMLQTLFYQGELCTVDAERGGPEPAAIADEITLAIELAQNWTVEWNPDRYGDPLRTKIDRMVAKKLRAQARKRVAKAKIVDIRAGIKG